MYEQMGKILRVVIRPLGWKVDGDVARVKKMIDSRHTGYIVYTLTQSETLDYEENYRYTQHIFAEYSYSFYSLLSAGLLFDKCQLQPCIIPLPKRRQVSLRQFFHARRHIRI